MRILIQNIGASEWVGGANYLKNLVACVKNFEPKTEFIIYGHIDQKFFGDQLKIDKFIDVVDEENLKVTSYVKYEAELAKYHEDLRARPLRKKIKAFFYGVEKEPKKYQDVCVEQRELEYQNLASKFDVSYLIEDEKVSQIRPNVYWIADFQHFAAPEFFSKDELVGRDKRFVKKIEQCTLIVVSSESVKKDYLEFCKVHNLNCAHKVRVLHFATPLAPLPPLDSFASVVSKYNLPKKFFLLPNQFWIHKNHGVVIDAIARVVKKHPEVVVVMTGNPLDYRHPNYFQSLLQKIAQLNIHQNIRILGLIPQQDLQVLMLLCHALINPSFFEGWSTVVEEAKILNKKIILSDINVHQEQAPSGGYFFDPENSDDLANKLVEVWMLDQNENMQIQKTIEDAKVLSKEKSDKFASEFLAIAGEAIGIWKKQ